MKKKTKNYFIKVISSFAAFIAFCAALISVVKYLDTERQFNFKGEWYLENTITESLHSPYIGIKLTFKIFVQQKDKIIEGRGKKIEEDGNRINIASQNDLKLDGVINKDTLLLSYIEYGRITLFGQMKLVYDQNSDTLEGTFSS